ncbi:hypothetical protein BpHYR1_020624, partial [Brachionus plicatilis]
KTHDLPFLWAILPIFCQIKDFLRPNEKLENSYVLMSSVAYQNEEKKKIKISLIEPQKKNRVLANTLGLIKDITLCRRLKKEVCFAQLEACIHMHNLLYNLVFLYNLIFVYIILFWIWTSCPNKVIKEPYCDRSKTLESRIGLEKSDWEIKVYQQIHKYYI